MNIVKQGFYIHDWVQPTKEERSTLSRLKQNFLISIFLIYRTSDIDQSRQVIRAVGVWVLRIVSRKVITEKSLTCNKPKLKDCETQTRNILYKYT